MSPIGSLQPSPDQGSVGKVGKKVDNINNKCIAYGSQHNYCSDVRHTELAPTSLTSSQSSSPKISFDIINLGSQSALGLQQYYTDDPDLITHNSVVDARPIVCPHTGAGQDQVLVIPMPEVSTLEAQALLTSTTSSAHKTILVDTDIEQHELPEFSLPEVSMLGSQAMPTLTTSSTHQVTVMNTDTLVHTQLTDYSCHGQVNHHFDEKSKKKEVNKEADFYNHVYHIIKLRS